MPSTSVTSSARGTLAVPETTIIRLRKTIYKSALRLRSGLASPSPLSVARDLLLIYALDRQGVVGDVFGDHRPRAGDRPVTDGHRGDEHRVRSDERFLTDHGLVLVVPVVVARDAPGPDVGA